tara:strand:- start:373 stop:654 length:282 start_codon:yes stop_codon:yes gene_type:complete
MYAHGHAESQINVTEAGKEEEEEEEEEGEEEEDATCVLFVPTVAAGTTVFLLTLDDTDSRATLSAVGSVITDNISCRATRTTTAFLCPPISTM